MTNRELMTRATELARQAASEGEVPVGAVISRNGEIIAEGRNMREKGKNALYHAEVIEILPFVKSYGLISNLTVSPSMIRI